jgi:hypothetical protein
MTTYTKMTCAKGSAQQIALSAKYKAGDDVFFYGRRKGTGDWFAETSIAESVASLSKTIGKAKAANAGKSLDKAEQIKALKEAGFSAKDAAAAVFGA